MGAVSGSALFAWLGPRLPRRQAYAWGFLVAGAPRFFALALASTLPPVLIVMLVAGLGVGAINPVLGAVEYERVPRHLQARVLGASGALAWLGIPFGGLLAGFAVEAWGLTAALVVFGARTAWRRSRRSPCRRGVDWTGAAARPAKGPPGPQSEGRPAQIQEGQPGRHPVLGWRRGQAKGDQMSASSTENASTDTLEADAIGFVDALAIGLNATSPAYSLAAVIGPIVALVGVAAPG